MENPNFLKQKYNLHNAPEVDAAVKRTRIRTGEKILQKPADKIRNYLDRFKEIIDRSDDTKLKHGMDALKYVLHKEFVIKPEEIPGSYYINQQRLAREQGHGNIEITDESKKQFAKVIITDQESSLDNWIDYLSSKNATYPDWLKYYAFRSMLGLSSYDKEKHEFGKRDKGTVAPFPDLNREALAYVLDAIEKKQAGIKSDPLTNTELDKMDAEYLEKILQGENFSKLYAWAIEKVTPVSREDLANVSGEWIKYKKGSNHMPLVESLQGHGTGWCTAGESTAAMQLKGGDFYVFYSYDKKGRPVIPRAAIRMQGGQIGEVRGVAEEQNLDPYIADVVKEKLKDFPDGQIYEKKSTDMKLLTEIERKTKNKKQLTKEDLLFLYEIDNSIEGFGFQRDPRIDEIRKKRKLKEDMSIIFECLPEQIAQNKEEINKNIKAYIGDWNFDIFQTIKNYPNISHLYESFPFKKIFMQTMETDPTINSPEKAEKALKNENVYFLDTMKDVLCKIKFSQFKEKYDLVMFSFRQLGFSDVVTIEELYKKCSELGLEFCPAEVGPHLRLQYQGKEWMLICMEPIIGYKDKMFNLANVGTRSVILLRDLSHPGECKNGNVIFRFRKPIFTVGESDN